MIVSGSSGASGEQLVRTALAQFSRANISVTVIPRVRSVEKINQIVEDARTEDATILHTLVNGELRRTLGDFGDLNGRSFLDVWNGDAYRELLATYRNRRLCRECNMRRPSGGVG